MSLLFLAPLQLAPAAAIKPNGIFSEQTRRAISQNPLLSSQTPFSVKRKAAVRWRIARQRADIERTTREIAALEVRLNAAQLAPAEEAAEAARIASLREEVALGEEMVQAAKDRIGEGRRKGWLGAAARAAEVLAATQYASSSVFISTLKKEADPWAALRDDTASLLRLGSNLTLVNGYAFLPNAAPRLLPHMAAIYAKAAKLERYAPGILGALSATVPASTLSATVPASTLSATVPASTTAAMGDASTAAVASRPPLVTPATATPAVTIVASDDDDSTFSEGVSLARQWRQQQAALAESSGSISAAAQPPPEGLSYLELIEPHLDEILERFDDIEPHIPFVLDHLDALAPHVGVILKHLDALLLYAQPATNDEHDTYMAALLPYLPFFAPKLDALGPHLALLRPHLRQVLPVLDRLAPHADRFAPYVAVSANADVLVFYFGWMLRLPLIPRLLAVKGVPRACAWLARRLPRWPVRGRRAALTADAQCDWEGCELSYIENAKRYYGLVLGDGDDGDSAYVQTAVRAALGSRSKAAREWFRYRNNVTGTTSRWLFWVRRPPQPLGTSL